MINQSIKVKQNRLKHFLDIYLEQDGIFMIRMIANNTSDYVATDLIHHLCNFYLFNYHNIKCMCNNNMFFFVLKKGVSMRKTMINYFQKILTIYQILSVHLIIKKLILIKKTIQETSIEMITWKILIMEQFVNSQMRTKII